MSGPGARLRTWRPATPPLPEELARLVRSDDPEWFDREMATAVAAFPGGVVPDDLP